MTSDEQAFTRLGAEKFVSRTTFRTSGVAVSSPVWIAVDDDVARDKLTRIFKGKYRWEYRIFLLIERILARREKTRVLIRIRPTDPDQ